MDELSLVQRNEAMAVQQTPHGATKSLVPVQSEGQDTTYSFHMSPLPDFSVNEPDNSLNREMTYVAQRTNPGSLRQVHGTFALATEELIKHITDVEPYEPYWEHVRRLVLRQKNLITLHKLSDFCPRLEELDVSDNDIGQLSGVPSSLRTLKIPRNCLSNLTPWSHLHNLQYLDISGNDIEMEMKMLT
jgi:Leucine-rich repeat (LRR) protein